MVCPDVLSELLVNVAASMARARQTSGPFTLIWAAVVFVYLTTAPPLSVVVPAKLTVPETRNVPQVKLNSWRLVTRS